MNYYTKMHNRKSIRLRNFDYSQSGLYFITICVQNHEYLFGKIVDDKMVLNNVGQIVSECWLEIPKHFPNAILHEFVVMQNHVHGIIELRNENVGTENIPPVGVLLGAENIPPKQGNDVGFENIRAAGADNHLPPPPQSKPTNRNEFQKMIPRSIGSIVKGFKIGVTIRIKDIFHASIWQRNYYEHIIRNDKSYHNISQYIINNPKNWKEDKFKRK